MGGDPCGRPAPMCQMKLDGLISVNLSPHSRLTARVNPTIHGLAKPIRRIVGLTLAVNLGAGPPRNLPEVNAYGGKPCPYILDMMEQEEKFNDWPGRRGRRSWRSHHRGLKARG